MQRVFGELAVFLSHGPDLESMNSKEIGHSWYRLGTWTGIGQSKSNSGHSSPVDDGSHL